MAVWLEGAACRETGLPIDVLDSYFFPKRGEPTAPAKRICLSCPVREDCLDVALERGEKFGIWGGMSERERRRERRIRGMGLRRGRRVA